MFRHSETKKRSSFLPFMVFRLCLALAMFILLGMMVYQSFIYFSGISSNNDPIKILIQIRQDPKSAILALIDFDQSVKLINQALGTNLSKEDIPLVKENTPAIPKIDDQIVPGGSIILKFALVSDSHNDNDNLKKALNMAKEAGAKFAIGLGDYTNTGTTGELEAVRGVFDSADLPYYLTAGNHDIWEARDKKLDPAVNYNQVFGSPYQAFIDSNVRFILIYNSDDYEGLGSLQWGWLKNILEDKDFGKQKLAFVFLHEPLFHHTSDKVMGQISKNLIDERNELITMLSQAKINEIFAGHVHSFARFADLQTGLKTTTVGALTEERNIQLPRFSMVDVYDNGGYNVLDLEIK